MEKVAIVLGVLLFVLLTLIYYGLLLVKMYRDEIVRFLSGHKKDQAGSRDNLPVETPPLRAARNPVPSENTPKPKSQYSFVNQQPEEVDPEKETVYSGDDVDYSEPGGISVEELNQLIANKSQRRLTAQDLRIVQKIQGTELEKLIFPATEAKAPDLFNSSGVPIEDDNRK